MKTQTKIVIRKLPRSLTKEKFLNFIQPFNKFNYFRFCSADKNFGENGSARVYIDFLIEDDLYDFKAAFEGRMIVDDDGNEGYGLIEFAAFQKTPGKMRSDYKQGTVRTEAEYLRYLQEGEERSKSTFVGNVESNLEEIKNKEAEKGRVTTKLVEYMATLPKRGRKDDFVRRKYDFVKPFPIKESEILEPKAKVEPKTIKKNIIKDIVSDIAPKPEIAKVVDKPDTKKNKMSRRNDIKTYATNYEEYLNDYETYIDERSPKKGFENKSYRGGRQGMYDVVEEPKGNTGYSYYNGRSDYSGRLDGYYRNYDYYGNSQEYSQGTYPRPSSTKPKRGGGGRRPPSYSATRKD